MRIAAYRHAGIAGLGQVLPDGTAMPENRFA